MGSLEQHTAEDVNPFGQQASNSSRQTSVPVDVAGFDKNATHYDMSDHKYLIILNHHWFEKKERFHISRPSLRNGTYQDERRLREVFHKLGFSTIVLRNLRYKEIIDRLKAIVDSWFGKNRTPGNEETTPIRISCVCVAIMTHGEKGGQIRAVDKLYKLREVMDIFGKEPKLTNKPKLYFVQACRGINIDDGHTVNISTQADGQLKKRPSYQLRTSVQYIAAEETVLMQEEPVCLGVGAQRQPHRDFLSGLRELFMGCGGLSKGPDNIELLDSQNKSLLTVPTHADTLVVCSTVEEFLSYRDQNGSWMIQALCESIEKNHLDQNLLDMIIQMHRTVAYDKITKHQNIEMHNKKQMPETRFTLTKHLKFSAIVSLTQRRRHCDRSVISKQPVVPRGPVVPREPVFPGEPVFPRESAFPGESVFPEGTMSFGEPVPHVEPVFFGNPARGKKSSCSSRVSSNGSWP